MSEADVIKITRRQFGKLANLPSGNKHSVQVKTAFQCYMLEVEDVNFHHDSAVLLPDFGVSRPVEGATPEQDRVTGLAVLYACYRHAREHPQQSALVVGHTDRSGATAYNQSLSELRAANVLHALQGNRDEWVAIALQKSKVEDYQQILIWLTHSLGWSCDPGSKSNVHDAQTHQAVEDFQTQYNERFSASIDVDGGVGPQTWGAFFDVYMLELTHALGTDDAGLEEARKALQFTTCDAIGCGEEFPVTSDRAQNYKSPVDRRVEILFFDPGEEPSIDCHAPRGACEELYGKKMYRVTPIPVTPLPLPSGVAVHVMLKVLYQDPEAGSTDRPFPEGMPVTIAYGDGTRETEVIGEGGMLDFFALREHASFTLRFISSKPQFVAVPSSGEEGQDELVAASQVEDYHRNKQYRLFSLPLDWGLSDSDWTVTGTTSYDESAHHFKGLDDTSVTAIGSTATPVQLVLDPHWLCVRFEYFDRVFGHADHAHERVCTPPLILEGFNAVPAGASTPDPDVRSNWIVKADDPAAACQAIPWILQNKGTKPDSQVLVRFRTEPSTFIVSDDATTRRIAVVTDTAELTPGPERLKYYDLPEIWKSLHYHARPATGDGTAFENLTADQLEDARKSDKPLVFSLDDMVVTDENLNPLTWLPTDRCAIFSHKFGEDGHSALTTSGLYEADASNKQSYLTKEQAVEKTRNYVTDYPNWTRLVVAQGNLCDVFDQRTPDVDNQVVGARAAVRWVDAMKRIPPLKVWAFDADGDAEEVTGANVIVRPGRFYFPKKPDPIIPERPDGEDHSFFTIQPFFEQKYIRKTKTLSTGTYDFMTSPDIPSGNRSKEDGVGRFDMALLRCCDTDGGTETAVALKYFKFIFDFGGAPDSLSGDAAQKQYVEDAVSNIPKRWNGPDGSFNAGPAVIEKQDGAEDLHVKVLWFCQATDRDQAHYAINVVSDSGRSFMNSTKGLGELRESANNIETTGSGLTKLVVAHECGHGGSLPDEYSERGTECSYFQKPLRSNNIVSDFYQLDGSGMMNSSREVRARYFWHVAEWLRRLHGGTYKVRHDAHEYELPKHPNNNHASPGILKSFVHWPLKAAVNTRTSGMDSDARVDVLFYALGQDKLSAQLIKPGTEFDSVLVIQLKMKISFPTKASFTPDGTFGRVRSELNTLNNRLDSRFNDRWRITSGSVGGESFSSCLVHFSSRYVIPTITNESPDRNKRYLKKNGGSVAAYGTLATSLENDHDVHLEVNVIDPPTTNASNLSGKTLRLRSDNYNRFDRFITEFLGMPTTAPSGGGPFPANAALLPLVQKVMTSNAASIQSL